MDEIQYITVKFIKQLSKKELLAKYPNNFFIHFCPYQKYLLLKHKTSLSMTDKTNKFKNPILQFLSIFYDSNTKDALLNKMPLIFKKNELYSVLSFSQFSSLKSSDFETIYLNKDLKKRI